MPQSSEEKSNPAGDYHPWSTYLDAREEAKVRGDRRVGTEHLAVALLMEADLAEALGCDPPAARAALHAMDREALTAVGLDGVLEELPSVTPERGRERAPRRPSIKTVMLGRIPLTPGAKHVLRDSSRDMRRIGRRHPGPEHVMAALLERERPDPAAELFAALGVDIAVARGRLVSDAH
jgi:Clp amino terminal domain, pathogenicity island component